MTRDEVDRALGGTPCICGDLKSWHPKCYAGKSPTQIQTARARVYSKARKFLARQRKLALLKALRDTPHPDPTQMP